jgi:hypothetical protein
MSLRLHCVIFILSIIVGISPFLTEREVFDSPSRTARLCDAFWVYAYHTHTEIEYVTLSFLSLLSFFETESKGDYSGHVWFRGFSHQLTNSASSISTGFMCMRSRVQKSLLDKLFLLMNILYTF